MVQLMTNSIRNDLREAIQNLSGPELDSLADTLKVPKSWTNVVDAMDDPSARRDAWEWLREPLDQAYDAAPETDPRLKHLTELRHLRYALAQCIFFFDGSMPRW